MRVIIGIGLVSLAAVLHAGCSDDGFGDLNWNGTSDGGWRDSETPDASMLDGTVDGASDGTTDPEAPIITILAPVSGQVLSGSEVRVVAHVTDDDGVNSSTVKAVIPGGQQFQLSRLGYHPSEFSGDVDLSSVTGGPFSIVVQAEDIHGAFGAASVDVKRDIGPRVEFITPVEGQSYYGSVMLAFFLFDGYGVNEASVAASVGGYPLTLTKTGQDELNTDHPSWMRFESEILFDAPMYSPPLRGLQEVTVQARNIDHGVQSLTNITFVVEDRGPDITIHAPVAGQVLSGAQLKVVAHVTDNDEVDPTSVKAVLPGGQEFPLRRAGLILEEFSGDVDLTSLPSGPFALTVKAKDIHGTESAEVVTVLRDPGPRVEFISPEDAAPYTSSVTLAFFVIDSRGVAEATVSASIGSVALPITKLAEDTHNPGHPTWIRFECEVVFNDPMFSPSLRDIQQIVVRAQNIDNSVESISEVTFMVNAQGPSITIMAPAPGQALSDDSIEVRALISDDDGIDLTSVLAKLPEGQSFRLFWDGSVPDEFVGTVDLSLVPSGPFAIAVEAKDTYGAVSVELVQVVRDTGPRVEFIKPLEGERHKNSVELDFFLHDIHGVDKDSVIAKIAGVSLPLGSPVAEDSVIPGHPRWVRYRYVIDFNNDSMFDPLLRGPQRIEVEACNIDNVICSEAKVDFVVDQVGPVISILTPSPAQILGQIFEITASVQDPAGVHALSVKAVLAHSSTEYVVKLDSLGGDLFHGTFDSRKFPGVLRNWIFPSLSVRAKDALGNESEAGFLVALDHSHPIASLDPPPNFRMSKRDPDDESLLFLSHEQDPVGPGVPNDTERAPQVFFLRARIEDQGNRAENLLQVPIALVDQSSVRLFVLGNAANKALVVDSNNDGYCDTINPLLAPTTLPQTDNEVLALAMQAIPPGGDADFRIPPLCDFVSCPDPTVPCPVSDGGCQTGTCEMSACPSPPTPCPASHQGCPLGSCEFETCPDPPGSCPESTEGCPSGTCQPKPCPDAPQACPASHEGCKEASCEPEPCPEPPEACQTYPALCPNEVWCELEPCPDPPASCQLYSGLCSNVLTCNEEPCPDPPASCPISHEGCSSTSCRSEPCPAHPAACPPAHPGCPENFCELKPCPEEPELCPTSDACPGPPDGQYYEEQYYRAYYNRAHRWRPHRYRPYYYQAQYSYRTSYYYRAGYYRTAAPPLDGYKWGPDILLTAPDPLCTVNESEGWWHVDADNPNLRCHHWGMDSSDSFTKMVCMTYSQAIFYTADTSEPAIYSLPPVQSDDSQFCSGLQFDALANNIPEGWACVAIIAVDNVGNIGVSKPLRIFVDYTRDGVPFYNVAEAPDCTGTYDKQSHTTDPGMPCLFDSMTQEFPENEIRRADP